MVTLVRNAQGLLEDAKTLLALERYPRALALAVLAREEVGKAVQVLALSLGSSDIKIEHLVSHREKLLSAAITDFVLGDEGLPVLRDRLTGRGMPTNDLKKAAFYVDLEDGAVRAPTAISPAQAAAEVQLAESLIVAVSPILGQLTGETLGVARLLNAALKGSPAVDGDPGEAMSRLTSARALMSSVQERHDGGESEK